MAARPQNFSLKSCLFAVLVLSETAFIFFQNAKLNTLSKENIERGKAAELFLSRRNVHFKKENDSLTSLEFSCPNSAQIYLASEFFCGVDSIVIAYPENSMRCEDLVVLSQFKELRKLRIYGNDYIDNKKLHIGSYKGIVHFLRSLKNLEVLEFGFLNFVDIDEFSDYINNSNLRKVMLIRSNKELVEELKRKCPNVNVFNANEEDK